MTGVTQPFSQPPPSQGLSNAKKGLRQFLSQEAVEGTNKPLFQSITEWAFTPVTALAQNFGVFSPIRVSTSAPIDFVNYVHATNIAMASHKKGITGEIDKLGHRMNYVGHRIRSKIPLLGIFPPFNLLPTSISLDKKNIDSTCDGFLNQLSEEQARGLSSNISASQNENGETQYDIIDKNKQYVESFKNFQYSPLDEPRSMANFIKDPYHFKENDGNQWWQAGARTAALSLNALGSAALLGMGFSATRALFSNPRKILSSIVNTPKALLTGSALKWGMAGLAVAGGVTLLGGIAHYLNNNNVLPSFADLGFKHDQKDPNECPDKRVDEFFGNIKLDNFNKENFKKMNVVPLKEVSDNSTKTTYLAEYDKGSGSKKEFYTFTLNDNGCIDSVANISDHNNEIKMSLQDKTVNVGLEGLEKDEKTISNPAFRRKIAYAISSQSNNHYDPQELGRPGKTLKRVNRNEPRKRIFYPDDTLKKGDESENSAQEFFRNNPVLSSYDLDHNRTLLVAENGSVMLHYKEGTKDHFAHFPAIQTALTTENSQNTIQIGNAKIVVPQANTNSAEYKKHINHLIFMMNKIPVGLEENYGESHSGYDNIKMEELKQNSINNGGTLGKAFRDTINAQPLTLQSMLGSRGLESFVNNKNVKEPVLHVDIKQKALSESGNIFLWEKSGQKAIYFKDGDREFVIPVQENKNKKLTFIDGNPVNIKLFDKIDKKEILSTIKEENSEFKQYIISEAVKNGNKDTVKLLLENDSFMDGLKKNIQSSLSPKDRLKAMYKNHPQKDLLHKKLNDIKAEIQRNSSSKESSIIYKHMQKDYDTISDFVPLFFNFSEKNPGELEDTLEYILDSNTNDQIDLYNESLKETPEFDIDPLLENHKSFLANNIFNSTINTDSKDALIDTISEDALKKYAMHAEIETIDQEKFQEQLQKAVNNTENNAIQASNDFHKLNKAQKEIYKKECVPIKISTLPDITKALEKWGKTDHTQKSFNNIHFNGEKKSNIIDHIEDDCVSLGENRYLFKVKNPSKYHSAFFVLKKQNGNWTYEEIVQERANVLTEKKYTFEGGKRFRSGLLSERHYASWDKKGRSLAAPFGSDVVLNPEEKSLEEFAKAMRDTKGRSGEVHLPIEFNVTTYMSGYNSDIKNTEHYRNTWQVTPQSLKRFSGISSREKREIHKQITRLRAKHYRTKDQATYTRIQYLMAKWMDY